MFLVTDPPGQSVGRVAHQVSFHPFPFLPTLPDIRGHFLGTEPAVHFTVDHGAAYRVVAVRPRRVFNQT